MSNKYLGSHWYKFDFHTHTPASSDYKKMKETQNDWLKALMVEKVDCVAITDHVSGLWIDKLKDAYSTIDKSAEWYRPLHLFPGCEITVSTGQSRIHILAIFDPSSDSAKITAVLGQCGIIDKFGDAKETSATVSVNDVISIINKAGGIAIPAHIDGPKGLLNGIKNTNHEIESWLKEIKSAEFVDLAFLDSVNSELSKAAAHLAKLQGSDGHECCQLGKKYSWIKMGKPSIQGLKLALHDHGFCVDNNINNPNTTPNLFLKTLKISQMRYCGRNSKQPAMFELHPLFNAIIGGRGSGKSTFIESIRLALGRENEVSELKQIKEDVQSFRDGVTIDDTEICVELQRRDEVYQSIWKHNKSPYINKLIDGEWSLDNGKPEERFHVSLYSQKQIHALASNTNALLDIIDRSSEVDYSAWKARFDSEQSNFLGLHREIRQLQGKLDNKSTLESQKDDLNSDIDSFEKGGHKDIFNAYQTFTLEKQKIENASSSAVFIDTIDLLLSKELVELELMTGEQNKPDYLKELEEIHATFESDISLFKTELLKLKESIIKAEQNRINAINQSSWHVNGLTITKRYEQVVQEYDVKGGKLNPEQYEDWLNKRNKINSQLEELKIVQKNLDIKIKQSEKSFKKLYVLRRKLQMRRQNFIQKVIGGNRYVKMNLVPFANKTNIEKKFREYIGVESSFASSIYQDDQSKSLLFNLFSVNNLKDIVKEVHQLKNVVKTLANGNDSELYRIDNRFKSILVQKLAQQPETIDRLITWWPDDQLTVEYVKNTAKGKFENIEKGSAGQKAAAILAFLLSYGDNPIIVDQPEDDLDNALIYELIVHQIHENKKRRQIIIVTHNPNIVVNGDAEFVNILHFHSGQVQVLESGCLSEKSVRTQICNIMEGGEIAFTNRYNRLRMI